MKENYEKMVSESNYKLLYGILCKQIEQLRCKVYMYLLCLNHFMKRLLCKTSILLNEN